MTQFESLAALSARLNEATENLNTIIDTHEERLRALNLGVEAWASAVVSRGDQQRVGAEYLDEVTRLGWMKYKGKWQFMLKTEIQRSGFFEGDTDCPYTQVDEASYLPLKDATRPQRARAVALFDDLEAELRKEVEKILNTVTAKGSQFMRAAK